MKISLEWLSSILGNTELDVKAVAGGLTSRGIEVEKIEDRGAAFNNVVIGEILTMEKHPNADKLSLLLVSVGKENLKIVCGAKNMKPGDKVAVALVGAKLPNGLEIKKATIRGFESTGMCCSEVELGLAAQSNGIMILDNKLANGTSFAKAMSLDDITIEIAIAPNRGDLLGHKGVAVELVPILGISKIQPKLERKYQDLVIEKMATKNLLKSHDDLKVTIDDPRCCRYIGCYIKNVHIKESPEWMKKRLEAIGLRPINNLVDITNYIMHETGQPLHVFDAKTVKDSHIIVRSAKNGESIKLLDGKTINLTDADILITDAEKPLALAGIMGGEYSGISESTKDVILECAYFDPSAIRRSSKKLCVSSDSSYRFERGIDFNGMPGIAGSTLRLISELSSPETIYEPVDIIAKKIIKEPVNIDIDHVNKFLGIDISYDEISHLLNPLGFTVETRPGQCKILPPSFRNDINIEADLIEEIARTYGYDKIPAELPAVKYSYESTAPKDIEKLKLVDKIRDTLSSQGYNECVSYSFVPEKFHRELGYRDDEVIKLLNPIVDTMNTMRVSLVPSMLGTIKFNFNRRNMDLKFFELGRVYFSKGAAYERPAPSESVAKEKDYLCFACTGTINDKPDWSSKDKGNVSFYTLKGDLELLFKYLRVQRWEIIMVSDSVSRFLHPSASAIIRVYGKDCGFIGKVHPKMAQSFDINENIYIAEINLSELSDLCMNTNNIQFKDIPKFPTVRRDISFLIQDTVEHANISACIRKMKLSMLKDFGVFDLFKGKDIPKDKKSMAYYFVFGKEDSTLTDEEVDKTISSITEELKKDFFIEIR